MSKFAHHSIHDEGALVAAQALHVWILSPYHTGSHRLWAEGLMRHSRHHMHLLAMDGRFWKWRMQGGAMELASLAQRQLVASGDPDVIVATDMVNLPAWLALLRRSAISHAPVLLYMHENQLTYPWRPGEKPDLTYGAINWLSQLCADTIAFNSRFHLDAWFEEAPRLLKHFPDYTHLPRIGDVRARSIVLPVGIEIDDLVATAADRTKGQTSPTSRLAGEAPLIVWNQRWEYDKRPDRFFNLLFRLQAAGVAFRLAVAGENFRMAPLEFAEARQRLSDVIVHWGYVDSRQAYCDLLRRADLLISTTDHEFFGISVLEGIAAGVFPLLPSRLSYPELIPDSLHSECLYQNDDDLYAKALDLLLAPRPASPLLRQHVTQRYGWQQVATEYDFVLEELANRKRTV
jgi:glycosyltransferase involved in cell wall biosynthesis